MIIQKGKEHLVKDKQRSNIYLRILSGLVLVPLFVVAILWFGPLFYLLMLLVAVGMLSEWYDKTYSSIPYLLIGLIIILIPIGLLISLNTEHTNRWLIILYFCIIWSVDTFAMIGGKTFGGAKLAPKVSPKKTWSGLITGVISAGLVAVLVSFIPSFYIENYYFLNKIYLLTISCILALVAQLSDLFISYFKRKFNIKDSGRIIPGHGGVLDRFDSIILTAPVLFFISKLLCFFMHLRNNSKKLSLNNFLALLLGYFVFHCIYGNKGIIAYLRVNRQLEKAYDELKLLRAERVEIEHNVKLLRPESLNKDMLDEQARKVLGVAAPNEQVFITKN